MTDFDPYEAWLDIPLSQRPINYYTFLGLLPLSNNLDDIETACKRRRERFQKELLGTHGAEAQTLLNELKKISDTLLNPVRKEVYDQKLSQSNPIIKTVKLETGQTVGPYKLVTEIEKTSAGSLWQVTNTISGHTCLMKILPQRLAQRPQIAKRFIREMQLSSQLNHENIVCASDSDAQSNPMYYVIPCKSLTSLESFCRQKGVQNIDTVLEYIIQAAQGLDYLHWKAIIHRNIRPDMLFLDENGLVKVGGLLTAKVGNNIMLEGEFDEQLTQDGQMLGAADYMAPEQATNASAADARCDVYSLGCTMYWLLTGHPVYDIKDSLAKKFIAHQRAPIPVLSRVRSGIPKALDETFQKMLAKKPENRYQSMKEVIEALKRVRILSSGVRKGKLLFWTIIGIGTIVATLLAIVLCR